MISLFITALLFLVVGICISTIFFLLQKRQDPKVSALEGQLITVTDERDRLLREKNQERERLIALEKSLTAQETEKLNLDRRLREHREEIAQVQKQLSEHLENIGHRIFHDHTQSFRKQSTESITALLEPLKSNIQIFSDKISGIIASKDEIVEVARSLTQAMRGDSRVQGNWGEFILTSILEASGLREGEEYVVQGKDARLTNVDGQKIKPDVIVQLPEGKHVIIDSKVSLTHYEALQSEENKEQQALWSKKFIDSMYAHVDGLSSKKYHTAEKLLTPEIVLMFVPLEGAFCLAMQTNKELWTYAWNRQIVIVSPTTLFATLRTIESMWKRERQNKHALQIAKEAGLLYDKFSDFVTDLDTIGTNIDRAGRSLVDARTKLEGRGGIASKIQNLKDLGAKATKKISEKYLVEDSELPETPTVP